MTAIKLLDGTVLYCKDIEKTNGVWTLNVVRSPSLKQRIEKFDLHEDSIEVYFHVIEGGKYGLSKNANGAPTSA